MHFLIDVTWQGDGWQVEISEHDTGHKLLAIPRRLGCVGDRATGFPLPPEAERPKQPANQMEQMCAAQSVDFTEEQYRKWVGQTMSELEMKEFGQYLFRTLLGNETWDAMQKADQASGSKGIQLILSWLPEETALTRLPWEMMCNDAGFLMAEKFSTLTRRIAGTAQAVASIPSPPRVLFVVGSRPNDPVLRPGAEYLGLLRSLSHQGLALRHQLLLEASTATVEEAVRLFQPSVVHFICHGEFDADGNGCLRMMSADKVGETVSVDATQIYQLMRPSAATAPAADAPPVHYPQILVLTACYSASSNDSNLAAAGQVASPLAIELLKAGIPIVVGMAGEIADQACRLFTRKFYEALLTDGDIAAATAWGRRAGILAHGGFARNRVDWTLPTLFTSAGAGKAQIPIAPDHAYARWQAAAESLMKDRCAKTPPCFGRMDLLRWQHILLADYASQRKLGSDKSHLQILALDAKPDANEQHGRTWALDDAAERAMREGHIPCILPIDESDPPRTFEDLLTVFFGATDSTLAAFRSVDPGFPAWDADWEWTRQLLKANPEFGKSGRKAPDCPPPAVLHKEIEKKLFSGSYKQWEQAFAVAFRLDLQSFYEVICRYVTGVQKDISVDQPKLLLLIDDVHRMGDAVTFLLETLIGAGLSSFAQARVILTFLQSTSQKTEDPGIAKHITDYLTKASARTVTLGLFGKELEGRLAYEHLLFHYEDENKKRLPYTPLRGHKQEPFIFKLLQRQIKSVPSNLTMAEAQFCVETIFDLPDDPKPLREADDDDALNLTR